MWFRSRGAGLLRWLFLAVDRIPGLLRRVGAVCRSRSVGEQSGKPITLDPPELARHSPGPVQDSDLQSFNAQVSWGSIRTAVGAQCAHRNLGRFGEAQAGSESAADDLSDGI